MPAEKATAIVLRTYEFSESSLVVTLFSREFGKLRALAKGGRRLKGPFESALDLLALCRIVFLRKSSDALDLLTESKLSRRFRPAGRNLSSLYAGYYIAELLGELTDDYDPYPELFDLADETLMALSSGEEIPGRILRFELGALRILGHLPSLRDCVQCGTEVPVVGRVAFGHLDGGLLCNRCQKTRKQVVMIHAGTLKTIERLADPDNRTWQRIDLDAKSRGELRAVLNRYLCNLLGRKPKMHRHLGLLSS